MKRRDIAKDDEGRRKIKENIKEINAILEKNPELYHSLSPLQRRVVETFVKRDLDRPRERVGKPSLS